MSLEKIDIFEKGFKEKIRYESTRLKSQDLLKEVEQAPSREPGDRCSLLEKDLMEYKEKDEIFDHQYGQELLLAYNHVKLAEPEEGEVPDGIDHYGEAERILTEIEGYFKTTEKQEPEGMSGLIRRIRDLAKRQKNKGKKMWFDDANYGRNILFAEISEEDRVRIEREDTEARKLRGELMDNSHK